MKTFTFVLLIDGPELGDEEFDALHEAGCSDALFATRGRMIAADFDRQAPTFANALVSAILDVEGAVPGLRVIRVEPDDFVNASTIAERTRLSREYIRLLVEGKRGPGGFPEPRTWLDGGSRIWEWSQVADWFQEKLNHHVSPGGGAPQYVAALNGVLEARRHLAALAEVAGAAAAEAELVFPAETIEILPTMVGEEADELKRALARA